jgi:hypothetical protein
MTISQGLGAGWRATGLHPLNPDKVLSQISHNSDTTPPQTASADGSINTPGSLRAIRRIIRQFRREGAIDPRVVAISRASEKLATHFEIVQHENRGLREAIKVEKRKRKRRKAMGLFDPEETGGQPVFFSPAKVELARQRFADQEQAEEQRKQAIADRRLKTAIKKGSRSR